MPNTQPQQSPLVAPLASFGRNDISVAGGKGANLGELTRSGFLVPPGFIITTTAFDLVFGGPRIRSELDSALTHLGLEQPDATAQASSQIRRLVEQATIPEQLSEEILSTYRRLKNRAVAVRSSATAEDLPGATFAGQQETVLNVIGDAEVIRAIRVCWASLWSERAIAYRARQNIDQHTVKLAVVVQEMVDAAAAGVMFTADPVTGSRKELVIDANPGLGEAVVAGLVTPDHFVVSKRPRKLISQQIGRREVIVRAAASGGTMQVSPLAETIDALSLPPHAALELVRLGVEIEHHYGAPQDIEWAWSQNGSGAGQIYILQARPMTALPTPLKVSGPMRMVVPMLAEMWPVRPYPMDMTTFTGAIERAIGNLLVAIIGKSAPAPDQALLEEDGVVIRFQPPTLHPSPGMLVMPWLAMWRTRRYDLSRWEYDPALRQFTEGVRALEQRDPGKLSWSENLETIQAALALIPSAMGMRERYLPKAILGLAELWILLSVAGRTKYASVLISGIETKTTKTNEALESLAQEIRRDEGLRELFSRSDPETLRPALQRTESGRAFLQRFDGFLREYGHREMTLTVSQPAWQDDPDGVLSILKVLAASEPRQQNRNATWQQARDELLRTTFLGKKPFRGWLLRTLNATRYLFQIREDTHFYATMVQPAIRRTVLALGQKLVQAGALDRPEDIFHLRLEELEAIGKAWPISEPRITETRALVARRKAKRDSLANEPMVDPRLLLSGNQHAMDQDVLLHGTSGSPGVARGPAKVVLDVSDFGNLRPGDVLVAPVTNPAWTPLFQRAAAVVVDTGGAASHAAIVAREYGIPAVMGTVNGTKQLKDGQWIRVDGSRGLVLKEEEAR